MTKRPSSRNQKDTKKQSPSPSLCGLKQIHWTDNRGSGITCEDAFTALVQVPDQVFRMVVTSPPYFGLRDYGIPNQIGAEETLDEYVRHLVDVFREIRRTLADDGTVWINIGDSYTSGNRKTRDADKKNRARKMNYRPPTPDGLKPKDLIGIPWRLAFALQQDGWYLRTDIIWHKPNCQPESVKDRPTRSHEYLFLFSKNQNYFYNYEIMKEPDMTGTGQRNIRTVWSVNTVPNTCDHSAVFPEDLIEPCIRGGSEEGDTILDPFCGTGTVGMVCHHLNRKFVGIELNREYADISSARLSGKRDPG